MIENFIEFMGRPNRTSTDLPRVTLNKKGILLLNKVAFRALDEPAAVKLFFDGNNQVIGIKAADIRHSNSFAVRQKDKWHNRIVCASPFCKHFQIHVETTILFNDVDIDSKGLMKLDLRKSITIGRGSC